MSKLISQDIANIMVGILDFLSIKMLDMIPGIIVTTPEEIAYHEGLMEITGREGGKSWQVKLLKAWWRSCHLDTTIIKRVVRTTWWDLVGKLDGVMVTYVVNWLIGDQEAFDSIPVDRQCILKRLKKKIVSGSLPKAMTLANDCF